MTASRLCSTNNHQKGKNHDDDFPHLRILHHQSQLQTWRREVFAAFSNPATKAKWFTGPMGGEALERVIEVKTGGSEVLKFKHPSGMVTHFMAKYHTVEKDKRIVYSYDLMIDSKHHSTSLAVIEFTAAGKNTDMIFTEFVAWHDGTELSKGLASREHGTSWQFDKVAEVLK